MNVRLIALTQPAPFEGGPQTAEELIVYAARVSNPNNQNNHETGDRLLRYCLKNGHWSVFETASMTVEIKTSRAIAAQILRHRSFTFQEFSQRYAVATELEPIELRAKGTTNRQGSNDNIGHLNANGTNMYLGYYASEALRSSLDAYSRLIDNGVAPECARMVLPLCVQTTLYMTGSVRSWIHYFQQRCSAHAQKEHREVACAIREIFEQQFPDTAAALAAAKQPEKHVPHSRGFET